MLLGLQPFAATSFLDSPTLSICPSCQQGALPAFGFDVSPPYSRQEILRRTLGHLPSPSNPPLYSQNFNNSYWPKVSWWWLCILSVISWRFIFSLACLTVDSLGLSRRVRPQALPLLWKFFPQAVVTLLKTLLLCLPVSLSILFNTQLPLPSFQLALVYFKVLISIWN
jgi:hypothetical protein